jgi:nicotinate-nucleotide pyrophosphorylase (carboxylating)
VQTFAVVDRNVHVRWTVKDGDTVHRGQQFGTLKGSALSILTGERIALNFLQRMSGIATTTAAMVAAVQVRPRLICCQTHNRSCLTASHQATNVAL